MQDQLDIAMHCGTVGKDEATFCINIVSIFSWNLLWSQEKIKAVLIQNFGRQTKGIMVFLNVAYYLRRGSRGKPLGLAGKRN